MRPFTLFLQVVCLALGVASMWAAFFLADKIMLGGVVVGGIFLYSAAALGFEHTANPSASRKVRIVFKTIALLAMSPLLCMLLYYAGQMALEGRIADSVRQLCYFAFLATVMGLLAFDTHPAVRRLLLKRGISSSDGL